MDQRGRCVSLANTIFIIEGIQNQQGVGFNSSVTRDCIFDEEISTLKTKESLNSQYQESLRRLAYEVSFEFDINSENKRYVNSCLYDVLHDKKEGSFVIKKEELEKYR